MRKALVAFATLTFLLPLSAVTSPAHAAVLNTVVDTIPVGGSPLGMAIAGNYAYVANFTPGTVSVVDLTTNTVTQQITVGPHPVDVGISGHYAYVTMNQNSEVVVIDLDTNAVITGTGYPIPVGPNPENLAIAGNFAYVANRPASSVTVINIDPTSQQFNTVAATISSGFDYPWSIAAVGNLAYVTNYGSGGLGTTVSVVDINPASLDYRTVIQTITVGQGPMNLGAVAGFLYVANFTDDSVSVIDINPGSPTFNQTVRNISVGNGPAGIAGQGSSIYIANCFGGTVSVVDSASGTVKATITVDPLSTDVAISNGYAYVTNQDGPSSSSEGTVSVIWIGLPASAAATPMWQQAIGRTTSAAACPTGYTPSWDYWPNGGTGGYVCNRFLPRYGS